MKTRDRNNEHGATAVEFALVLPVLMMMIFAIVEFGGAFYRQQVLTAAARAGARYGTLVADPRPGATDIAAESFEFLEGAGLNPNKAMVNVDGAGGETGGDLVVQVLYPARLPVVSSLGSAIPGGGADPTLAAIMLSGTIVAQFE